MRKGIVWLAVLALAPPLLADVVPSVTTGTTAAIGDRFDVIWDNIPGGYVGGNLISSQWATAYPFRSGTADDFMCPGQNLGPCRLDAIDWYGGYWNQTPIVPNTTAFLINFYADNGTGTAPVGGGMPDPTPAAMISLNVPIGNITVQDLNPGNPNTLLYYGYDFDPPIYLPENNVKYWLEIVSINQFPPQWGWAQASNDQQMHGAVQGFPLLGKPFWTDVSPVIDVAFTLYGECIPEPASLLLLGLAGLLIRRR